MSPHQKTIETIKYDDGKTLWDWGSLLVAPSSLLLLGYVLQLQQQKRAEKLSREQQERAENFSEDQQERASNEIKEEVLQAYFDRLSVLLIDKNLIALSNKLSPNSIHPEEKELLDSSLDIIRARTLSILRRFENDAKRKTSVIDFLVETEIVSKLKLNLSGANLSEANLSEANLSEANLSNANLSNTELSFANLSNTELSFANLLGAELSGANLSNANLSEADLSGANLSGANLSNADLSEADLSGANFSGANLSGTNILGANLKDANLEDIEWSSETLWLDKSAFTNAKNIPEDLKKELDIIP